MPNRAPASATVLAVTEKAFMAQVRQLAETFGWAFYHPYLSIHSPRGWPDIALCRPPRLILAELKTDKGIVSDAQAAWLDRLRGCETDNWQPPELRRGLEVYLWRPADLDDIAAILQVKAPPLGGGAGGGANEH